MTEKHFDIKEALFNLGYSNISDYGAYYRTRPIYRDSDSNTSLSVNKSTGRYRDFGRNKSGSFEELVKLSLNLLDIEEAKEWIEKTQKPSAIKTDKRVKPLKCMKVYDGKNLSSLKLDHSYWINRGISEEVIKEFRGGLDDGIEGGKMQGRYVFPIFNSKEQIVGFSGRLTGSGNPKWKHLGQKTNWVYPAYLSKKILQEKKEVILVESIGDALALYNCGIRNTLVTFGLDVGLGVLTYLLRLNCSRIIVSLNNDAESAAGNNAARKMYETITKHFDKDKVHICLPEKNDFGDMNKEEILEWSKRIN
tara:strand:+ start:776 stop:1696 length:921 start_codon:yes stop_codon:yes gene_type:complete